MSECALACAVASSTAAVGKTTGPAPSALRAAPLACLIASPDSPARPPDTAPPNCGTWAKWWDFTVDDLQADLRGPISRADTARRTDCSMVYGGISMWWQRQSDAKGQ
jgi:hypothetical protein